MGIIEIEGMEFYAYHGCFKEEQVVGNRFLVDIYIETDTTKPEKTDNIVDALNYQRVYEIISEEMELKSHLLEHIGRRVLDRLNKDFSEIIKAKIKVSKMNPPMGGQIEKVSVTLTN